MATMARGARVKKRSETRMLVVLSMVFLVEGMVWFGLVYIVG